MKFYIETYGCQMNVADSELVTSILIKAGHENCVLIDDADLILFNTCSVRAHAEDRVLGRISNELHRKRIKPHLKLGVLGCMAQRIGEKLKSENLGIDYVIGVDHYDMIPELIENNADIDVLGFDSSQVYSNFQPTHQSDTCGFITIMRGCNNFCSYCIVPHVRGRERSRAWQDVLIDARIAADKGLKDITLLGQNVNSYFDGDVNFPKLLKLINEVEGIERIRYITSHPKDLSGELISVIASCDKICEHIHLPLQSGSNRILELMNRGYTLEHYSKKVDELRKAIPDISITTDLIVGFPSESEAEYQATLKAVKDIDFDYAFCFKYSSREGTEAASFDNHIDESLRLSRLQQLIELQRDITLKKFKAKIGTEVEVYVENLSRKSNNMVSGKTRDYKIAVLGGSQADIGKLKIAKVIDASSGTLICG